jgi:hypothetical protein
MNLTDLVIPPQVKLALRIAKFAIPALALVALLVTIFVQHSRITGLKAQNTSLTTWQVEVQDKVTRAYTPAGMKDVKRLNVAETLVGLDGIIKNRDDLKVVLAQIDAAALEAKKRSDAKDAAYAATQKVNEAKAVAAQKQIDELRARQRTGDPVKDAVQLDKDSKAAWLFGKE